MSEQLERLERGRVPVRTEQIAQRHLLVVVARILHTFWSRAYTCEHPKWHVTCSQETARTTHRPLLHYDIFRTTRFEQAVSHTLPDPHLARLNRHDLVNPIKLGHDLALQHPEELVVVEVVVLRHSKLDVGWHDQVRHVRVGAREECNGSA